MIIKLRISIRNELVWSGGPDWVKGDYDGLLYTNNDDKKTARNAKN